MELLIIAVIAALGGAYFVSKGTFNTPSNNTASASGGPPALVVPHLKPNAILLTDEQIAQQNLSIGFSASNRASFINEVPKMLVNEQLVDTGTSLARQCGGSLQYQGPPLALTSLKGGSLALGTTTQISASFGGGIGSAGGLFNSGFASAGSAAAKAIPIIGIAVGAAISILSTIAAHHAAAVKNEQGLECRLIPSANQALQVIENAVMTGQLTPAQGQSALATLLTDFKTQAQNGQSGQLSEYSGHCNAMCWYYHFLAAIVMRKQNRYSQFVS